MAEATWPRKDVQGQQAASCCERCYTVSAAASTKVDSVH